MNDPIPVPLPPAGHCPLEELRFQRAEADLARLEPPYYDAIGQRDAAYMRAAHYLWNLMELVQEALEDYQGEVPADVDDLMGDWDRSKDQVGNYMNDPINNPAPIAYMSILSQDIAGTIGDLVSIVWHLAWIGLAALMMEAALSDAEGWQAEADRLEPGVLDAREELRDARQALIDCLREHRICATCGRGFPETETTECQGCGSWFCDAHYIDAVAQHEVATGTPTPPP
ncbi:MAG: hypothetical protein H6739_00845 [Alphaproteobacteria bacterium]|nr:hypothetical protein [Alphaproteobacteria bacterium]